MWGDNAKRILFAFFSKWSYTLNHNIMLEMAADRLASLLIRLG